MLSSRLLRWATAATVAASLLATTGTATAAVHTPVATRLVVHVTPVTVLRGSLVVFSGSVSPAVPGLPVVVQRLVGHAWQTLAKEKVAAHGVLAFSVKAPHATGAWVLRVVRAKSATSKAAVGGTLHLLVVATAFAVTAKAKSTVGQRIVVSGVVSHKAAGSVTLQLLVGKTWHTVAKGKLSHAAYTVGATLVPGARRLRVAKTFSTTIAGGFSPAFTVTVPTNPRVVEVTLPAAMARRAYSATLTATGGTAPYTWTATGLPSGLTLTSAGLLTGTPTLASSATVTITVQDTGGRTGSAALPLTISRTAGTAWAWGINDSSELGNGSVVDSHVPTAVTGLTDAVQIVGAGSSGGYALRADGTVAAWGGNNFGALGNGSVLASTTPVAVTALTGVVAVASGIYVGMALKADGTVWAWGYGANHQLGNGTTTDSHVPVQVSNLTGVTAIASNGADSYALKSDGTVWSWGDGANGALGNGATLPSSVPVQVSGLSGITSLAGSQESGYALKTDGTVWAWGWNAYGQLGDNTTVNRTTPVQVLGMSGVTAISGGFYAGLALKSDGTVWDWGLGQYGALGNNAAVNSSIPVAVSGLATVVTIAGGGQSGYATKADGTTWAWGHNGSGQLGNASTTDSTIPVPVSVLRGVFALGGGNASGYAINLG
jgi:alpha-tubulin suppressor-like RCC1 family protein